jgi:hypothetical protein
LLAFLPAMPGGELSFPPSFIILPQVGGGRVAKLKVLTTN